MQDGPPSSDDELDRYPSRGGVDMQLAAVAWSQQVKAEAAVWGKMARGETLTEEEANAVETRMVKTEHWEPRHQGTARSSSKAGASSATVSSAATTGALSSTSAGATAFPALTEQEVKAAVAAWKKQERKETLTEEEENAIMTACRDIMHWAKQQADANRSFGELLEHMVADAVTKRPSKKTAQKPLVINKRLRQRLSKKTALKPPKPRAPFKRPSAKLQKLQQ